MIYNSLHVTQLFPVRSFTLYDFDKNENKQKCITEEEKTMNNTIPLYKIDIIYTHNNLEWRTNIFSINTNKLF